MKSRAFPGIFFATSSTAAAEPTLRASKTYTSIRHGKLFFTVGDEVN